MASRSPKLYPGIGRGGGTVGHFFFLKKSKFKKKYVNKEGSPKTPIRRLNIILASFWGEFDPKIPLKRGQKVSPTVPMVFFWCICLPCGRPHTRGWPGGCGWRKKDGLVAKLAIYTQIGQKGPKRPENGQKYQFWTPFFCKLKLFQILYASTQQTP